MGWFGRSVVLLGVAAVSSCSTWMYTAWTTPSVPLTMNLPMQTAGKSPAFDARVKERFSVGTPMADVARELMREGFVRRDWNSLVGKEHFAERYDGSAPACAFGAWIVWKSDEQDRLTEIGGTYQVTCL